MSSSFLLTILPFSGDWGVVLFAIVGSVGILIVVLLTSFVISDTITLLIIGIMIGSIASALVSVLQYFGNPDEIKSFLLWTFGSLSGVTWGNLKILGPLLGAVYVVSFFMQKSLNTFLLGDNHARGLGTPVRRNRIAIILITSLAAGAITAFVGPIAFIGVAVPHLARNLFRTADHLVLIPAVILMGAGLMLACDIISQLPGSEQTLPINSVSALFGAPVVIWVIIKGRKQSGYF